MSRLTRTDVKKIASLAHLELTPDEVDQFTSQLTQILEYAEHLQEVDTSTVPPTGSSTTLGPALRNDDPRPSLTVDEALANAPSPGPAGVFRVPKVIGS